MIEFVRKLVRPIIAFCFTGTVTYLAIIGKIDPAEILPIAGIIVGFYFGERAANKSNG